MTDMKPATAPTDIISKLLGLQGMRDLSDTLKALKTAHDRYPDGRVFFVTANSADKGNAARHQSNLSAFEMVALISLVDIWLARNGWADLDTMEYELKKLGEKL